MAKGFRTWDDYFIPGTTVLKNKAGLVDAAQLHHFEEAAAEIRMTELAVHPIQGSFGYDHMKAIHRRIFQDVYEWAGQERVGPDSRMTKDGPDVVNFAPGDPAAPTVVYGYYPGPGVASAAADQYRKLAVENHLVGMPRAQFVDRLAEHWGELNTIHSFREGNIRTQFVFFSQLAENAGYVLDQDQFKPSGPLRDEFVHARFHNQATGRTDRLAAVLDKALNPLPRPPRALAQIVGRDRSIVDRTPRGVDAVRLAQGDFPQPATDAVRRTSATGATPRRAGRPAPRDNSLGRGD